MNINKLVEGWDIDEDSSCEYTIELGVTLYYLNPPEDPSQEIERKVLQTIVNAKAGAWICNTKNKQNLMNIILGNTNILIP